MQSNYNITNNFNLLLKKLLKTKLSQNDIKVIKFLKYINEEKMKIPSPSKPRIITRSTAARLLLNNDDTKIFTEISKLAHTLYDDIRVGNVKHFIGMQFRDLEYNYLKKKKKVKKGNQFFNCFSIKIKTDENNVNMKFFNNGSITMTGCIGSNSAENALNKIIKYIDTNIDKFDRPDELHDIKFMNLRTTMVNYNFGLNFKINRIKLFNILKNNHDLFVSFEPEKYQAVKISYMFNKSNKNNDGVCYCTGKCKGKGWGDGNADCKKVTIAIFQSGNTGINGSRNYEQILEAYNFVIDIATEYYTDIVRLSILEMDDYKLEKIVKIVKIVKIKIKRT
tara:strand:- start:3381 stop:4388 length:1008 start_codon:yes stop_codon:yes gene_type:complete